jgi:hypothetical protein
MNEKQPFMTVDYNSWNDVTISNSSATKPKTFPKTFKYSPYTKMVEEFQQSNLVYYSPQKQAEQAGESVYSDSAEDVIWATEEESKTFWEKFSFAKLDYNTVAFKSATKKPKRTIRKIV